MRILPIAHIGQITGVGDTFVFGLARHKTNNDNPDTVYLEIAGPVTAVESVWARLVDRQTVTFQSTTMKTLYVRHRGLKKGDGPTYERIQRRIPAYEVDHMILLDRRFNQPDYSGKSVTFLFDDPEMHLKLADHVRQLVNLPVFPDWAERLLEIGRLTRLVHPLDSPGGPTLSVVELNRTRWENQIAQRVGKGELAWPGDSTSTKPLSDIPHPETEETTRRSGSHPAIALVTGRRPRRSDQTPVLPVQTAARAATSKARQDRLRGHKLLPASIRKTLPGLYTQEQTPTGEQIAHVKFFCANFTWYALEYDPEKELFFGWVENESSPWQSELGYFSLAELEDTMPVLSMTVIEGEDRREMPFPVVIERDLHFRPKRLKDCPISLKIDPPATEAEAPEDDTTSSTKDVPSTPANAGSNTLPVQPVDPATITPEEDGEARQREAIVKARIAELTARLKLDDVDAGDRIVHTPGEGTRCRVIKRCDKTLRVVADHDPDGDSFLVKPARCARYTHTEAEQIALDENGWKRVRTKDHKMRYTDDPEKPNRFTAGELPQLNAAQNNTLAEMEKRADDVRLQDVIQLPTGVIHVRLEGAGERGGGIIIQEDGEPFSWRSRRVEDYTVLATYPERYPDLKNNPTGQAKPPESDAAPTPEPPAEQSLATTVTHEGDWTWVSFSEKPGKATREALKQAGFRWGRQRQAWYAKRRVEESEIAALTALPATEPTQLQPGERPAYCHLQVEYDTLPEWARQIATRELGQGKRPRCFITAARQVQITPPMYDYTRKTIFARNERGEVKRGQSAYYTDILASTEEEQALYFGGTVDLTPGQSIVTIEAMPQQRAARLDLFLHPKEAPPPPATDDGLTDLELAVLAMVNSLTKKGRADALRQHQIPAAEYRQGLESLIEKGLITRNKAGAIGRTVKGRQITDRRIKSGYGNEYWSRCHRCARPARRLPEVREEVTREGRDRPLYLVVCANCEGSEDSTQTTPATIDSLAKQMLYDTLGQDEQLALAVDQEIRRTAKHEWRGHLIKEREVRQAIHKHVEDEDLGNRIFDLVKGHSGY